MRPATKFWTGTTILFLLGGGSETDAFCNSINSSLLDSSNGNFNDNNLLRKRQQRRLVDGFQQHAVYNGDDFEGYGDESADARQAGQKLAHEFYHELEVRKKEVYSRSTKSTDLAINTGAESTLSPSSAFLKSTDNRWTSAGLFNKRKRGMTIYSDRNSGISTKFTPPTPRFRSSVQLSISGIIAVIILSRFFWVQALISAGLIGLYLLLILVTSNNHGGADWMGDSSTNLHHFLSSSVSDGIPAIEQTSPTTTPEDGTSTGTTSS